MSTPPQGVQIQDEVIPPLLPLSHATRAVLYNALFSYMKRIPAPAGLQWKTFSQAIKHWDAVPKENQPAMFLERQLETWTQTKAYGVTKFELHPTIWIYFRADGLNTQNTYPDMYIDPLKDAIEQLFQTLPALGGRLTLGGVCQHCFINGIIASDPGLQDASGQAVVRVPITIWI